MKVQLEILLVNYNTGEVIFHKKSKPMGMKFLFEYVKTFATYIWNCREKSTLRIYITPIYSYKEGDIIF